MSIKAQTIHSPIFIPMFIFFSANMQAANINGPAIEIIFINESIFLSPFLEEILIRVSFCYYILIFDKSLENPFFYEKIFFILEMTERIRRA